MPTGSFAPDSPSSTVPLRPDISRWPSTENTTAGSVGAIAVATSKAGNHSNPNAYRNSSAPPAVEEDVYERDGEDLLDGIGRRRLKTREQLDRDRGADEHQDRDRDVQPFSQPVRQNGDQPDRGREQYDQSELPCLVHVEATEPSLFFVW